MSPEEVARLRRSLGFSQAKLADRLGVHQTLVSAWENGRSVPQLEQQEQMKALTAEPDAAAEEADSGEDLFGDWLREERASLGVSRARLSELSGVSPQAIYNLETGKSTNPQAATRRKLEAALGTDVPTAVSEASAREAEIEGVGQFEDFDPHDRDAIPEEPGVYVFYDLADHVLYVGEGGNVRQRITQGHMDKFWYRDGLLASASFVRIDDEMLRKQIERTLIRFLKSNAVLNKQHVVR